MKKKVFGSRKYKDVGVHTGIRDGDSSDRRAENNFSRNESIHGLRCATHDPPNDSHRLAGKNNVSSSKDVTQSSSDREANSGSSPPSTRDPESNVRTAEFLGQLDENGGNEDKAKDDGTRKTGAEEESRQGDGQRQLLCTFRVVCEGCRVRVLEVSREGKRMNVLHNREGGQHAGPSRSSLRRELALNHVQFPSCSNKAAKCCQARVFSLVRMLWGTPTISGDDTAMCEIGGPSGPGWCGE